MDILGGLFSGIGNWIGASSQAAAQERINAANLQAQRDANAFNVAENRRINDLNWQRHLQAWNMANEYNSPKAQMARLREAGVNGNLAAAMVKGSSAPVAFTGAMPSRVSAALMSNSTSVANPMSHFFNILGNMTTAVFDHWRRKDQLDDAKKLQELREREFSFRKDQAAFHNTIALGDYKSREFRHRINNYIDLSKILASESTPRVKTWKDLGSLAWQTIKNPATYANVAGDLYDTYVKGGKIHFRNINSNDSSLIYDTFGQLRGGKDTKRSTKGLYF